MTSLGLFALLSVGGIAVVAVRRARSRSSGRTFAAPQEVTVHSDIESLLGQMDHESDNESVLGNESEDALLA